MSCQDEKFFEESIRTDMAVTRAVPTLWFNWENIDWMPTSPSQRIPNPWNGAGSLTSFYGLDVINDRKAADGWELLYSSFDPNASGSLNNPYFVLYNKYRGLLRMFFYTTTQFVGSSTYIQDGISVISSGYQSTMLNFLGKDIIDPTINQSSYSQMQPAPIDATPPLATNKWYMVQYELAYDPNISNISYNQIQLKWQMNYHNITEVKLGGEMVGKLNGAIGSTEPDIFTSLNGLGKVAGTGILAGIGREFISHNTLPNDSTGGNKLGLPKNIFKDITKGISSALSGAVGGLPGAAFGLLSSIIGGSSGGPTPISFELKADLTLNGTGTNSGSFPAMPISFWMPGTNISSSASGYIPLYNKTLGVINFTGKPVIETKIEMIGEYSAADPYNGYQYTNQIYKFHIPIDNDYSSYLIINPEILDIANVTIKKQDIVAVDHSENSNYIVDRPSYQFEEGYTEWQSGPLPSVPFDYDEFCVRFMIEVKPKNGGPTSLLVKSLALTENKIRL